MLVGLWMLSCCEDILVGHHNNHSNLLISIGIVDDKFKVTSNSRKSQSQDGFNEELFINHICLLHISVGVFGVCFSNLKKIEQPSVICAKNFSDKSPIRTR